MIVSINWRAKKCFQALEYWSYRVSSDSNWLAYHYHRVLFIDDSTMQAPPVSLAGSRLVIYLLQQTSRQNATMWLITAFIFATIIGHVSCQDQIPLTEEAATKPLFTLREQSSDLCDAGSRQWTGTVNVTADKSMFFCTYKNIVKELRLILIGYFESRNDPETDPLLLWMSGYVDAP